MACFLRSLDMFTAADQREVVVRAASSPNFGTRAGVMHDGPLWNGPGSILGIADSQGMTRRWSDHTIITDCMHVTFQPRCSLAAALLYEHLA